jgi:hypothetical protein
MSQSNPQRSSSLTNRAKNVHVKKGRKYYYMIYASREFLCERSKKLDAIFNSQNIFPFIRILLEGMKSVDYDPTIDNYIKTEDVEKILKSYEEEENA